MTRRFFSAQCGHTSSATAHACRPFSVARALAGAHRHGVSRRSDGAERNGDRLRSTERRRGGAPLVGLLAALVIALAAPAAAQRVDDQLALARVAVSEAGLLATDDEVAAIGAVLRSRCERCRIATVARQYSSRVFDLERRDSRAWVAFLDPSGRRPAHWPEVASWSRFRARWLAVYETAGRVVRGDLEHRCTETPRHWGGPMDAARAARMGLVRIDCGDTRNDFYRLPRREEG